MEATRNFSAAATAEPRCSWVFYDGDCPLCRAAAAHAEASLSRQGFLLLPLQTPGVTERLGVSREEMLREMKLLTPEGRVLGGADALLHIGRKFWWAWPVLALAAFPGGLPFLRWLYARVAANRYCLSGVCSSTAGTLPPVRATTLLHSAGRLPVVKPAAWWPLVIFTVVAFLTRPFVAAWIFMWLLAGALFAGCKWLTFHEARAGGTRFSKGRAWGYLLAWVGMDPTAFRNLAGVAAAPRRKEWLGAATVTLLGIVLLWGGARVVIDVSPLAAGWVGMIGIILTLHFGSLRLLALVWRKLGIAAEPLMREPWRASSVSEFWGRRWNTGFHRLAHRFLFLPAKALAAERGGDGHRPTASARFGPALFVFLVSGLIHDLVITVPAGGGYGLPTAYFLFQGCAAAAERSALGRYLGLSRGWRGHLFAWLIIVGPAFWLFPPVFVRNIILPMLQVIGAI